MTPRASHRASAAELYAQRNKRVDDAIALTGDRYDSGAVLRRLFPRPVCRDTLRGHVL